MSEQNKIVSYERVILAPVSKIFELIADPANQPRWDGNDNLTEAAPGQRVHKIGDVFVMTIFRDRVRENHVVEFEEGRVIAWLPSIPGDEPFGQLWKWELEESPEGTLVRHTYDWRKLNDPIRLERARNTTSDSLKASVDRLATLAEK